MPRRSCAMKWNCRYAPASLALMVVMSAGVVDAAEIIVQNDTIASAGAGTPLLAFIPGERAAAWLTAPVAGDIVGVQVLWDSNLGPNPPSQEFAIDIYAGGTFPTPGATLATISAPILSDATVNEFRYLFPPATTSPLQVPVTAGQTFVVSLAFFNQSANNVFASGVEYDGDGCQGGKNAAYALPGGWIDACTAGVPGDLGIRAIIKPIPEPSVTMLFCIGVGACALAGRKERQHHRHGR